MEQPKYTTQPLDKETFDLFSNELNALLEKYNCEVGIVSTIQILKRVEVPVNNPDPIDISSLYEGTNPEKTTDETPKAD